jgi:alkylhydroperoxidase family enzyme
MDKVPEREAGTLGRRAYGLCRHRFGEVAEPLAVVAHHPSSRWGAACSSWRSRSKLVDERLKSLAVLKAATVVGCEFCIDIGSAPGIAEVMTEDQLRELRDFERSEAFSPWEGLMLRYAVVITRTAADAPDELFDALRKHLSEAQLVELTAAIALRNYRAWFNHAFGVGSQGLPEGSFCAVPETLAAVTTTNGGE